MHDQPPRLEAGAAGRGRGGGDGPGGRGGGVAAAAPGAPDRAGRRPGGRLLHRRPRSSAAARSATVSCGSSSPPWAPRARCSSRWRSGGRRRSRAVFERLGSAPGARGGGAGAGLSVALGARRAAGRHRGARARGRLRDLHPDASGRGWPISASRPRSGRCWPRRGGALLIALVRRFGRRWWLPGTVAVAAIAVVFVWLAPVVLAPLFNKFTPLPADSQARAAGARALARRAGVDVGEVYRVDASRRVRSLNAYVDGIGSTRRVVLYDNLLRRANRPELRSVVAHELGHVKHDDVLRGLAFLVIVTPLGLLFAERARRRARSRRTGVDPPWPGGPARLLPRAGPRRARPRGAGQPALAPGGGERRHLRAPAHPRSAGADRRSSAGWRSPASPILTRPAWSPP